MAEFTVADLEIFFVSSQALGGSSSIDILFGDLNVDGYLDAFVVNIGANNDHYKEVVI